MYGSTTGDILESDQGRGGPPGSCGEVLKPSYSHHLLSVNYEGKTPAHKSVLNCVQSFNSGKETAQAAVHEWY